MYSPVTVGETFPLLLTLAQDNGQPLSLVNATSVVLVFKPTPGSPPAYQRFVATGTVAVTDAVNGKASFTPSTADSAKLLAGQWLWQAVVTFSGGAVRYGAVMPLEVIDPL